MQFPRTCFSNDRQMQNCKIADCKLQVAGFVDSLNVTEKKRKRRETTGGQRDMLVHCWVFLLASDVRLFRVGLTNRAQAFQAVGALQWQAGEARVQTKYKCEQHKL